MTDFLSIFKAEGKTPKKPYGKVKYADPGHQKDGKARYPVDTAEHVKAAWSYINTEKNGSAYSPEHLKSVKSSIVSAWKKLIDPKGPPSAVKKIEGYNPETGEFASMEDYATSYGPSFYDPSVPVGAWANAKKG